MFYKGLDVKLDMYSIESDTLENGFMLFFGKIAYLQALIFCVENNITGKIVYCMTKTSQHVINGEPIKRGRKKKETRTDKIGAGFHAQIPKPPKAMEPIE